MLKKIGAVVVSVLPLSAFAAVDVTAITATATDIASVGGAVLGVLIGIKAIKFVRRAL